MLTDLPNKPCKIMSPSASARQFEANREWRILRSSQPSRSEDEAADPASEETPEMEEENIDETLSYRPT